MTTFPATIVLVVTPSLNTDGSRAHGLFNGRIADRVVVKHSPAPFASAARILLAEGIKPNTPFILRHEGRGARDAMRLTVGRAARLGAASPMRESELEPLPARSGRILEPAEPPH